MKMANLERNVFPRLRSPQMKTAVYLAAAQTFYVGSLVGINLTTGLVKKWNNATSESIRFLGRCLDYKVANGTTDTIRVSIGGDEILDCPVAGATVQGTAGDLVYGSTDNSDDLTVTPTTVQAIGEVKFWISSTVAHVKLFEAGVARAFIGS